MFKLSSKCLFLQEIFDLFSVYRGCLDGPLPGSRRGRRLGRSRSNSQALSSSSTRTCRRCRTESCLLKFFLYECFQTHYYQPGFTLVGGGQMTLAANTRDEKDLIPKKATWINRRVEKFLPASNALYLRLEVGNWSECLVMELLSPTTTWSLLPAWS